MDQIGEFVDERQKAWCIHCGGWIVELETTRDHVPTKALLQKPYPANLPVVRICKKCNISFSLDEEYLIAFIGVVFSGTTDPERQHLSASERVLKRNKKLRARLERAKIERKNLFEELIVSWKPELDRINRVIIKNARGHAFYEFGEPMLHNPEYIHVIPLMSLTDDQRADFEYITTEKKFLPEVGSRMMTRIFAGQDMLDSWVIVQDGIYRYALEQTGGILVRIVLYEYLAAEVYWDT